MHPDVLWLSVKGQRSGSRGKKVGGWVVTSCILFVILRRHTVCPVCSEWTSRLSSANQLSRLVYSAVRYSCLIKNCRVQFQTRATATAIAGFLRFYGNSIRNRIRLRRRRMAGSVRRRHLRPAAPRRIAPSGAGSNGWSTSARRRPVPWLEPRCGTLGAR